ncbi:MAG TPA: alpha/beta hydrolase fold domain-containing protein [Candidatus Brocadiia bacterium]|nr:alpha/beta hydrolase fold domain-containing protein [Candidatus Brocadiia bacterium]
MRSLLPVAALITFSACSNGGLREPCAIEVEEGEVTASGEDRLGYALYFPKIAGNAPRRPYPAVILTHGFMRNYSFHANNARYMAQRGIVVMTPNMSSLFGGGKSRSRNADNTVGHVQWLAKRAETSGDPLCGLIDPRRIGLAGHSAGGAVSFEAAVRSQSSPTPVAALCLLDAVPWHGTVKSAASLKQLPFCSLRSEPSKFNADAEIMKLLRAMPFPVEDILLAGASHVDPENPSSAAAHVFAGGVHPEQQALYQKLMYLFFRDSLQSQFVETEKETYCETIERLKAEGKVRTATISPRRNPG